MRLALLLLVLAGCATAAVGPSSQASPPAAAPVEDCELMPVVPTSVGVAQPGGGLMFATIAGKLEAVDLTTGTQRWAVDGEWRPLVADDRDVVVTGGAQVRVYEAATGRLQLTSAAVPGVTRDWHVTRACRSAARLQLQWEGMTEGQHLACCNGGEPGHAVGGVVAIALDDGRILPGTPLPPEPPLAEWPHALLFKLGREQETVWAAGALTASVAVDEALPARLLLLRRDRASGGGRDPVVLRTPFLYQDEYRRRLEDGAPELVNLHVLRSTDGEWVVLQVLAPDRSKYLHELFEVATGAHEPFPVAPERWQGFVARGVLVSLEDLTRCQNGATRTLVGYDLHSHHEVWRHAMPCVPVPEPRPDAQPGADRNRSGGWATVSVNNQGSPIPPAGRRIAISVGTSATDDPGDHVDVLAPLEHLGG